jgi:hypothetical protein
MRYGTIVTLFHGYSHDIIMNAINTGKEWAAANTDGNVKYLFAGGLFGVLAAVNEAVESSYWTTLFLVMVAVWAFLYFTYYTVVCTLILMIPVLMSQFACEAFMYLMHIDLNVNSLPVAAVGAAMGVDYGIYHFSRMVDLADEGASLDDAVDGATATTGKAIFTATNDRRRRVLVVLGSEVPGRDGLPPRAFDGVQHVRRARARPGVDQGLQAELPDETRASSGRSQARRRRLIEARQLTKRFGGRTAIDRVTLRVARAGGSWAARPGRRASTRRSASSRACFRPTPDAPSSTTSTSTARRWPRGGGSGTCRSGRRCTRTSRSSSSSRSSQRCATCRPRAAPPRSRRASSAPG